MLWLGIIFGFVALFCLFIYLNQQTAATEDAQRPPVWATRDLPALHQLTKGDLRVRAVTAEEKKAAGMSDKTDEAYAEHILAGFDKRILLSEVRAGEEVKISSSLASDSEAGKLILGNTFEAGIPANTNTTIGGRLKVGDVVEIVWFPAAGSATAEPKRINQLVVASVPAGKVPDAPAETPAAAPAQKKPAEAGTAATAATEDKPSTLAETRPSAPTAAVIVLRLREDQIEDVFMATAGGSKWVLTRKSHWREEEKDALPSPTPTPSNQANQASKGEQANQGNQANQSR